MNILFAGDSITRGSTGASFVNLLAREYPGWHIKNIGLNGDTLKGISTRLIKELQTCARYDWVVLQGGYNDIMLPYFETMNSAFRLAARHQRKKGMQPFSGSEELITHYSTTIDEIRRLSNARIMLMTLGCINEDSLFILNQERQLYNQAIRNIAQRKNCTLADTGTAIDMELVNRHACDYFLGTFLQVVLGNPIISLSAAAIDRYSRKRNLSVTIDGVHLNNHGAWLFKERIASSIAGSRVNTFSHDRQHQ